MPKNQDALFRQWHMLRLVPRYPLKITVQEIRSALHGEGFEITERSIQRDLNELSSVFPLCCDSREKPYGWSWQKGAASFDLPALTISEALMLAMAEHYLHDLLPAPMVDQLRPHFKAARKRLEAEPTPHRVRSWLDKVRVVSPTQPLLAPKIDIVVQHTVSEALLRERQLSIRYLRRGEKTPNEYRIHPLALVQRGALLYLSCRVFDYEDARMLALHRIVAAQILEDAVKVPRGFSLDQQIDAGIWGFGNGGIIQIELVFLPGYGDHLLETPLSKDQTTKQLEDGRLKVSATVADTPQLVWWLLGFAGGVEVLGPAALRKRMTDAAQELIELYPGQGSQYGRDEARNFSCYKTE